MIRAVFWKTGFKVEGHADFDEYGKDVVCAAVSGMVQLAGYILKAKGAKFTREKGHVEVKLNDFDKDTFLILEILKSALKDVEKKYPDHLKVEVI